MRAEIVRDMAPGMVLRMADPRWDRAIVGLATRADEAAPLYSWRAAKTLMGNLSPAELYRRVGELLDAPDPPLVLMTPGAAGVADAIREHRAPVWDQVHAAIVGLAYRGRVGFCGVVYNMDTAVELLAAGQAESAGRAGATGPDRVALARRVLNERVLPATLGELTPWFVVPIKA